METMTQKDKELLLKDLCARLPHGVKVEITHWRNRDKDMIDSKIYRVPLDINKASVLIKPTSDVRPYLFPLSSMTEEQKKDIFCNGTFFISNRNELGRFPKHSDDYDYVTIDDYLMIYKKLIENHFDINGLIPKGLAIDATGLNIY